MVPRALGPSLPMSSHFKCLRDLTTEMGGTFVGSVEMLWFFWGGGLVYWAIFELGPSELRKAVLLLFLLLLFSLFPFPLCMYIWMVNEVILRFLKLVARQCGQCVLSNLIRMEIFTYSCHVAAGCFM